MLRMSHRLLLSAILLGLSLPVLAQEPAASNTDSAVSDRSISPEAQAVLDRMAATLRGVETFSIRADGTRDEVVAYGYKLQHNESATIIVQRPNKLRAEVSGDLRERTFVYDGQRFSMYSGDDQAWTSVAADSSLDLLIGGLLDAGIELPLVDVIYQAFAGTLTTAVRGGILVGESTIEGVKCDQLAFRQANADWQLWVTKGERALPRKILITTRHEVGDPQFQAVMEWNLAPKLNASTFVFTPPKDAEEISFPDAAAIKGGSN